MVTIRRATVQDAPALDRLNVRLLQAALAWASEPEAEDTTAITYQELYCEQMPDEHLDGLRPEEQATVWEQGLRRDRDRDPVLVAEEAGRVVGFAVVGPAQNPEGAGELYAITVDPDHWGTGAGRALLAAAQAELTRLGYAEAVLWVLPDNARARRFYEVAAGPRTELSAPARCVAWWFPRCATGGDCRTYPARLDRHSTLCHAARMLSSPQVIRHRLNRGDDRQLNRTLHTVAVVRLRDDPATRAYAARRREFHRRTPASARRTASRPDRARPAAV